MAFNKITSTDTQGKGVSGLSDTPGLSTTAMQAKFDELSKDVIIPKYNALIDELNGTGVANSSQVTDPTTSAANTIQGTLNNMHTETALNTASRHSHANKDLLDTYTQTESNLANAVTNAHSHSNKAVLDASTASYTTEDKASLDANTTARHTHSNKSVLDLITSAVKTGYDNLVTIFQTITGIQTTVTNDATKLPTGSAIVKYVTALGGGDMLKSVYDTDNDGIVDNSKSLYGKTIEYFATQSDLDAISLKTEKNSSDILIINSFTATTVFNSDGSITETRSNGYIVNTTFNSDGSITQKTYSSDGITLLQTSITTFNSDGSIAETRS